MHYESNYSYPLIVWLHSCHSDQRQLLKIMPEISTRNYIGVSFCGPDALANGGYGWIQSPDSIETAGQHLQRCLDLIASRFNVNHQQIYIGGLGQGGTMAFRVAFERPDCFAGVASIGGGLPVNLKPLNNWLKCRQLPVFWSQGRRSTSFPETNLCQQLRLLHIAGFSVTLRQYPCGNEVPDQCLADFNRWVMEQIAKSGESSIIC